MLFDPSCKTSSAENFPSIIVVNTCTVTSKADQKARRVIRKSLRDYPASFVIVTGCYAQLNKDDLYKLDDSGSVGNDRRLFVLGKDKVLGLPKHFTENDNHGDVLAKLAENSTSIFDSKTAAADSRPAVSNAQVFQFNPKRFSNHTRGSLKIQDGCDKHCTYCRVRLARGKSISLDTAAALERLRILETSHSEAVITGVNICQYRGIVTQGGDEKAVELGGLLNYLLAGTEKIALRLSSLSPDSLLQNGSANEDFAKAVSHKRIRPHFHLSVQSGSAAILEKMGRGYNAETVEKAVSILRGAKDDPFLACDIITGFPGETAAEFEKTYELCKKLDFAWIHVFPYSKRPGTPAFAFKDTVRESEVTERVRLLTNLAQQGRAGYVRRWLDREVEVLIETGNTEDTRGTSENYLKLLVQRKDKMSPPFSGAVLRCRLLTPASAPSADYDAIAREV